MSPNEIIAAQQRELAALHNEITRLRAALAEAERDAAMQFSDSDIDRVAYAICAACGENPEYRGDCRGNDFRWHDYRDVARAAIDAAMAREE